MKCKFFEKRDVSVGNDCFDHPTYECICKKKNRKISEYQCNRCPDRVFPIEVTVSIPVGRCDECPFIEQKRTIGAGYAFDYFCKALKRGNNKIAGYVEYDSEIPPVPQWCPFRKENL